MKNIRWVDNVGVGFIDKNKPPNNTTFSERPETFEEAYTRIRAAHARVWLATHKNNLKKKPGGIKRIYEKIKRGIFR